MVAEIYRYPSVFDVVGRPTTSGVTWAWAQDDLDTASVGRARVELAGLFAAGPGPHRLLVYLGDERFVDLRGLRFLLDLAAETRRGGGALVVVAPPPCLRRMAASVALGEETLPMVESVRRAMWWARTSTDL